MQSEGRQCEVAWGSRKPRQYHYHGPRIPCMFEGLTKAISHNARNWICIWVWNAESEAVHEHVVRFAWPSAIMHQAYPIIGSNSTVSRLNP